ncbi:YkuJ family protein [Atopococcus tabaci]|uniref:YkuJ family protein n=1 Tax=Atopococcus tabaci TaxID=269774 RepID=UPI0004823F40|nr:YkuJ family protein [Atopococcus tabaci]
MASSQLVPIIRRLEAMQEDKGDDIQVRRFEKDGEERCVVTYDKKTGTYELNDRRAGETFQFDNIDYIAVEILELMQTTTSA